MSPNNFLLTHVFNVRFCSFYHCRWKLASIHFLDRFFESAFPFLYVHLSRVNSLPGKFIGSVIDIINAYANSRADIQKILINYEKHFSYTIKRLADVSFDYFACMNINFKSNLN